MSVGSGKGISHATGFPLLCTKRWETKSDFLTHGFLFRGYYYQEGWERDFPPTGKRGIIKKGGKGISHPQVRGVIIKKGGKRISQPLRLEGYIIKKGGKGISHPRVRGVFPLLCKKGGKGISHPQVRGVIIKKGGKGISHPRVRGVLLSGRVGKGFHTHR